MTKNMTDATSSKVTLGPHLFNWPAEEKRDFYFRIADEAPVDSVCIGEVVCAKRAPFFDPYLPAVIARLQSAGKEVVYASLALVMTEREQQNLRDVVESDAFFIEANDIGCLSLLAGRPHAIGPFINVYNEGTLRYLADRGAERLTLPFELPAADIEVLAAAVPDVALEVAVFGRLPLAVSARCYHARAQGLHKNNCQYVCAADRDGMALETLDQHPFLAVNGTQTLSHSIGNLNAELERLQGLGIARFRLSPHDVDMVAVAQVYRDRLDGRMAADEAERRLATLASFASFSDGFFHGQEGARRVSAVSAVGIPPE